MKKIYLSFIFLILMGGIITTQYFSDVEKSKADFVEPLVFKPEILKSINLGLHNAASDLMWLSAIQYFGGGESEKYEKLPDYLNLASDLDPKFSYPYAFGALILPSIGYPDQGINLAKKGVNDSDPDWRIPYYLATTYHINKNDSVNAAKYFDLAANTAGAPEEIKRVAAAYGSRSDKREQTKQIWIGIYETTNDEVVKERARSYILHFEIMDFLDTAVGKYKKIYNKYPENINDLITGKILNSIPDDPFGFQFEINQTDGKISAK